MLIKLIKPYLKRIQCNDKFGENGRAVDGKIWDPLRRGGGEGTCVPALNFRYGRFARFEE